MTKTISEKIVAALPTPASGNKTHYFSGATLQGKRCPSGFAVRVTPAGGKSFVWFHRVNGKGHLETIDTWIGNVNGGRSTVLNAIIKCEERAKAISKGIDKKGNEVNALPLRTRLKIERETPRPDNISGLLDAYILHHRNEGKMRSVEAVAGIFERLVKPEIGHIEIYSIARSDIVNMLRKIAKESGLVMSDRTLAHVRSAFNWYAPDDEKFSSPIVKRMAKTNPKDRARSRILAEDELRDLWTALDSMPGFYSSYIRFLLLTATRRNEAADMTAAELHGDVWVIPAARYKTKLDHAVPLSPAARKLIGTPKAGYVFTRTGGKKAFSGFSKMKDALDEKIANIRMEAEREPMEPWTLHDLRRTARSLMSRAKVTSDHAERCLGHAIAGVRATYDWHTYLDEKRDAFEKLAALVDRILNPESNVVPLRA